MDPELTTTLDSAQNTAEDPDGVDLVAEDLIEEVSIDGMCGVY
jgi:mycofactocin precursor